MRYIEAPFLAGALKGKSALVIGGGSIGPGWGNGKAAAVGYARAGAAVVVVDLSESRARETADIINSEDGRAIAIGADATDGAAVRACVERAVTQFGGLHILHNNVGVAGTMGAPDAIDESGWDREMAVTLKSAYVGIRYAVPAMRQHGGVITNISSIAAVRFLKKPMVAYTAAKAALEALTRSCAAAYGRDNIRVNCIRVGFAETPLLDAGLALRKLTDEQKQAEMAKSRAMVPLRGEHGSAFDVAHAAVFLASDQAAYLSGVILNVDGALECAPL